MNFISNIMHQGKEFLNEAASPGYAQEKLKMQAGLNRVKATAAVATLASALFTLIGLTSSAALLFIAAPALYISYNVYKMTENAEDIASTPTKYISAQTRSWDTKKVADQLEKNTFFFDWAIKLTCSEIQNAQQSQHSQY